MLLIIPYGRCVLLLNFLKKEQYNNSSLYWIVFSFIMGQLKNTVFLLPGSSESASWVKTYFWVLKNMKKLQKLAWKLHVCPLNKNSLWTAKKFSYDYCSLKKYKMLFIYFFSWLCVYLSFCSFQQSRCAMTETAATVFAPHIETTSKCDSYPGLH